MASDPAISLSNVRVTAQGLRALLIDPPEHGETRTILDGVSFDVPAGGVRSILGESGGGKTTLLRCINRMVDAEGDIHVLGKSVRDWDVRGLRSTAVFVPQRSFLFGGSVRDELMQPLRWNARATGKMPYGSVLQSVGLEVALDGPSSELSEGQRHRLCIARALLLYPKLLLLDEPTGALDVRTSREMLTALLGWARENAATLVCVTHRPEDLEVLGGEALILLKGKVAGRYAAADVAARKVDAITSAFLGKPSGVSS